METLTVAAVLKTGGDYGCDDAARLFRALRRNLTATPYHPILLTDDPAATETLADPEIRPLRNGWPGWWSKMELFGLPGPVLYLDLDTVIVGTLDPIAEAVLQGPADLFAMLRDFNSRLPASGVMAWNGDRSKILRVFADQWGRGLIRGIRGDQDWLRRYARGTSLPVRFFQGGLVPEGFIQSYKKDLGAGKMAPPTYASLVCFHGQPRPIGVNPRPPWMTEHWA